MKLPKVRTFYSTYRAKSYLSLMLYMTNQSIESYFNTWNTIFPDYINLELLKYLLSIGSCVACRIYCYNGFIDGILIADDSGMSLQHITKIERSSKFKICDRFRKTGKDILIKINLNVWKE